MEKTAYLPGESGTIKAYFNTSHASGTVTKTIQVYSNTNGGGNIIRIKLKATVVTDLRLARSAIYFSNVVPGKSYTKRVFVENNMHKPLEIKGFKVAGQVKYSRNFPIKVKLVRDKDGKEFLTVTLKALKNRPVLESTNFTLSVKTNSKKMPEMPLYINVRMQKPIEIRPISLFMFGLHRNAKRVRRIQLVSNTGKPIEIISVRDTAKRFNFEKVREDKKTIDIWIGIDGNAPVGVFNTIIKITVKDGNEPHSFTVPARGSII